MLLLYWCVWGSSTLVSTTKEGKIIHVFTYNLHEKLDFTTSSSVIGLKYKKNQFGSDTQVFDQLRWEFIPLCPSRVISYNGTPSYASLVVGKPTNDNNGILIHMQVCFIFVWRASIGGRYYLNWSICIFKTPRWKVNKSIHAKLKVNKKERRLTILWFVCLTWKCSTYKCWPIPSKASPMLAHSNFFHQNGWDMEVWPYTRSRIRYFEHCYLKHVKITRLCVKLMINLTYI